MIRVEKLSVEVGDFSLRDVSLEIPRGSYGMLTGRTGCGKTTILESIAGLTPIRSGRIILADRDVTRLKPAERGVGYVPQDGALFTTMTVRDQLGFALMIRRRPAKEIARRVEELAEWLGIHHLLDRKTAGLSGGERQRVAIGRALSFEPPILLLDEPLSALDDQTRQQMYALLEDVQRRTEVTALHVTHHAEDVARLADIVFHVDHGEVCQVDVPRFVS